MKGGDKVTVGGGSLPAVRVELNPTSSTRLDRLDEVRNAITVGPTPTAPRFSRTGGKSAGAGQRPGMKASEYVPIIVAYKNGAAVRPGTWAASRQPAGHTQNYGMTNGKHRCWSSSTASPTPTSSRWSTASRRYPELQASIPRRGEARRVMERHHHDPRLAARRWAHADHLGGTVSSLVLVFCAPGGHVIRRWRCDIASHLRRVYLIGFSLNNLSPWRLPIATGFVVDDAIVGWRHRGNIERGMSAFDGARLIGAREVDFTWSP